MKRSFLSCKLLPVYLALAVLLSCSGCAVLPEPAAVPLTVTLLKVGKADAIILLSGTAALVPDTGEEEDGQEVVEFLHKQGILQVEAMIITHYDRDHVGGADTVLEGIPVKTVYVPAYEETSTEYNDFLAAAEAAKVPIRQLTEPVTAADGSEWFLDSVDYRHRKAAIKYPVRAAVAACLILCLVSVFLFQRLPSASVFLDVNPSISLQVNYRNRAQVS